MGKQIDVNSKVSLFLLRSLGVKKKKPKLVDLIIQQICGSTGVSVYDHIYDTGRYEDKQSS